jgi:hypothetical protein
MRDGSGIAFLGMRVEGAVVLWLALAMLLEPDNRFEPAPRSSTRSAILRVMLSRCNNQQCCIIVSRYYLLFLIEAVSKLRSAASLTQQGSETCHQACSRKIPVSQRPRKEKQETIIALVIGGRIESSTRIKERSGNWGTTRSPLTSWWRRASKKKRHED